MTKVKKTPVKENRQVIVTPEQPILSFYEYLEAMKIRGSLRQAYLKRFEKHHYEEKTLKEWKQLVIGK